MQRSVFFPWNLAKWDFGEDYIQKFPGLCNELIIAKADICANQLPSTNVLICQILKATEPF